MAAVQIFQTAAIFFSKKLINHIKPNKMKTLNNTLKFLSILLITGGLYSCEKSYYEPIVTPGPPVEVSFSNDIQPYFDTKCTSCHNGSGIPLSLLSGVSYDNLINGGYVDLTTPSNSSIYTKVLVGESMEQYASPSERTMTLNWIEQGALNN